MFLDYKKELIYFILGYLKKPEILIDLMLGNNNDLLTRYPFWEFSKYGEINFQDSKFAYSQLSSHFIINTKVTF